MRNVADELENIVNNVMSGLKDFQKKTVEHIDSLYRSGQKRILVSDEVGLGKTLIARGTIAKVAKLRQEEGDELVKVAYICSNSTIADQNLRKLRITSEVQTDDAGSSRLSMQHLKIFEQESDPDLHQRYIQLIPLTPDTSFRMKNVTGSLQAKHGKYYAVLNLYDHTGKRKQKWVSTGYEIRGNKKAAKAFLDELLVAYNKKQQAALKVIPKMKHPEQFIKEQSRIMALPLFLFVEEWIEHSSAKLQPTTIDGYRSLCNGRIKEFFESRGTTVYDLTGEDLNEFYAYLTRQGLKGVTQQKYHALIHSAYSFLVKHQYIDSNPCDFADRPKAEKYSGAYYTQSELTKLFRAAKESEIYIPVLLAAYYGLRRSEVLGIKWSNIDFGNGTIRITHKVVEQKVDGKYQTVGHDKMKTESSNRILPLMKEVAMALRRLKLHQDEQRRLCGNSYVHEYDDYVCVNEIGQLLRPNYVTAKFSELLKENGLKHIRYHDLRHSCASLLLANGVPMKEIQEWLGHSNYRTTADVYSHLDFSSKEHSAEIISHVLAV